MYVSRRASVEAEAPRLHCSPLCSTNPRRLAQKLAKTTYAQLLPSDHPDYKAPPTVPLAPVPNPPPPPPSSAATVSASAVASTSAGVTAPPAPPPVKKAQNQHTKRKEAEEKARQLAAEAEAAKAKAKAEAKPDKKAKSPDVWKVVKNKLDKTTQMKEKDTCGPCPGLSAFKAGLTCRTRALSRSGRVLAFEFMDLIPKSQYPDYYKIVKKPMSFNLIYVGPSCFPELCCSPDRPS